MVRLVGTDDHASKTINALLLVLSKVVSKNYYHMTHALFLPVTAGWRWGHHVGLKSHEIWSLDFSNIIDTQRDRSVVGTSLLPTRATPFISLTLPISNTIQPLVTGAFACRGATRCHMYTHLTMADWDCSIIDKTLLCWFK